MRVIRVELPSQVQPKDPSSSPASDEQREAVLQRLQAAEYEISEHVRFRAASYFPSRFSVFARTLWEKDRSGIINEIWVIDPDVRWPQGLLTRRAWGLFVPVLGHIAREMTEQRVPEVTLVANEKAAKVTVLSPTRTWRDPLVLSVGVFAATTLLWLVAVPYLTGWRAAEGMGQANVFATPSQTRGAAAMDPAASAIPSADAVGPPWQSLDRQRATPPRPASRPDERR